MLIASIPAKFPKYWAQNAGGSYIRAIPEASQIGIQAGAASLTDGFPPLTFTEVAAGGVPPFGQDANGILQQITQWNQWQNAGAPVFYDSVFSAAVTGYPQGAVLANASTLGLFWINQVDANTTDPDTGGANWLPMGRIKLGANTTFYVATTGNDSTGNGTSGAPWLTKQHAYNVLQANYDLNNFQATVQIADGSYTDVLVAFGPLLGQNSSVIFSGDAVTPDNCLTTAPSGSAGCYSIGGGAAVQIQGQKLVATAGNGNAITTGGGGLAYFLNCDFGACATAHLFAGDYSQIVCIGNYTISGGAVNHAISQGTILINDGTLTTLVGTPAFSDAYARASECGVVDFRSATFSGAATGPRYDVNTNGVINTGGGGASFLPGNSSGVSATGGQYV